MKQKCMSQWTQNILCGVVVAIFSLMCGCNSMQTDKTDTAQAEKILEKKNCTIPLSASVDLDLIWIEPGSFTMGSPEDELGRESDEVQHEVTLTAGYWLGKYEVTQAQYETVMGCNPSEFTGADLPVEQVTWNDAMAFCEKLTEIEKAAGRLPVGYEYTLPTEAQWEYACRAGTTTALNSGKNLSDEEKCSNLGKVGWYEHNSRRAVGAIITEATHPVGQKKPNAWGLYDMHGNVYEWCLDRYGFYPTSSVTDPTGPNIGKGRVIRGGSWYNFADLCRSASRGCCLPSEFIPDAGFRVALALENADRSRLSEYSIVLKELVESELVEKMNADVLLENMDARVICDFTTTIHGEDLHMVWCPSGTFTMGSPKDELGRNDDEEQYTVTLENYWIGRYEVTQAQYEAVMGSNPSRFKHADLPVECVSWIDAINFCAKLTEIEREKGSLPEGYVYILPTEAQWEYACRAGTTTALNSGEDLTSISECPEMDEVGWYWYNSDKQTHPVGQKKANPWGIFDMHGNVQEWCLDCYRDDPTSSVTDSDVSNADLLRVLRGGFWEEDAHCCRSAYRDYSSLDLHRKYNGFRVALSAINYKQLPELKLPKSGRVAGIVNPMK